MIRAYFANNRICVKITDGWTELSFLFDINGTDAKCNLIQMAGFTHWSQVIPYTDINGELKSMEAAIEIDIEEIRKCLSV